jgi:hypothetical protein
MLEALRRRASTNPVPQPGAEHVGSTGRSTSTGAGRGARKLIVGAEHAVPPNPLRGLCTLRVPCKELLFEASHRNPMDPIDVLRFE